jgi:methionine synthase II (cobalamin-independent)
MIPTEPIGSIPRPPELIAAITAFRAGKLSHDDLQLAYDAAVADTVLRFEATGSPVITDGEQRKTHNFASYCVDGLPNFAPDGFQLKFVNHSRLWPRLTAGPFRFLNKGADFLADVQARSTLPVKQAVISPSALSLFYPGRDLPDYSRQAFLDDLIDEHEADVRRCLEMGAHTVQIDFTEGRLAFKLDPTALGHFAALACQQVADRAQRGRLARAVAAEQRHHPALGHLQGHALEHQDDVVVDDLDAVDVEQDVGHGSDGACASRRRSPAQPGCWRRPLEGERRQPRRGWVSSGSPPACAASASSRSRTWRPCS